MNYDALKHAVNVEQLVSQYNLQGVFDDGEEIHALCPWHEEKVPSFSFSKDKKIYYCFGCGRKGTVIDFVMDMDKCSFTHAVDKLTLLVGDTIDSTYKASRDRDKPKTRAKEKWVSKWRTAKNIIQLQKSPYWQESKFPYGVIDYFELGLTYEGRLAIPIRDEEGVLVGYSSRTLELGDSVDKRYLHMKGFRKSSYLYNLYNVLDREIFDTLILTEGFSDVWRTYTHGWYGCVAIMGKEVSDEQIDLLLRHTYKVCLAFDRDESGVDGMRKFTEKAKNLMEIDWMKIPTGRDLGSLSREEFTQLFEERIKIA
jgi:DNA primase